MILNWMCLCVHFKYNLLLFTSFCSWVLQLIEQVLNKLLASLCKPVIHKLIFFEGGRGLVYYKSMWRNHKKGEPRFEISVGEARRERGRGREAIFEWNLVGEKSQRKLCRHVSFEKNETSLNQIEIPENRAWKK